MITFIFLLKCYENRTPLLSLYFTSLVSHKPIDQRIRDPVYNHAKCALSSTVCIPAVPVFKPAKKREVPPVTSFLIRCSNGEIGGKDVGPNAFVLIRRRGRSRSCDDSCGLASLRGKVGFKMYNIACNGALRKDLKICTKIFLIVTFWIRFSHKMIRMRIA